jgi:hypothetical protein
LSIVAWLGLSLLGVCFFALFWSLCVRVNVEERLSDL